ncbi:amino acid adenylation domain-containing protein [Streptomyces gobiensis]|uniref:amino acid adenylation domain-containing protein n=1 Tax=Streptomyces gobiensis TaxID=2875706 RepID=UPI001E63C1BF|nr:amino acid adenylation domain-containing protein [Streptomyces gobiensis]UGY92676.1 amino acid adenylation domain-containing protein [Streptomyces gobiensis]
METQAFSTRRTDTLYSTRLPDLLRQQASTHPEAVAVVYDGQELTYRELQANSSQLALYLRYLGAGADTPVGLYVEPSLELMIGAWGILASGGSYLPLSPEYPDDRLRYMIKNSAAKVIVTQEHLAARVEELAPNSTTIVTVGDTSTVPTGAWIRRTWEPLRPDNLAYVIYTSGSTGRPKGVMIEHRSIVSQLRWMQACGYLGPGTTVLQKTPMSFDAAQWEILAPAVGGRVVMGAPGIYRDPEALIDTIVKNKVTTLQCVPTLLQALLDTENLPSCTSLKQVFSGGEALTTKLARAFAEEMPRSSLVNLYGPTECTINATAHLIDPETLGDEEASAIVSIGVPVDNTTCFILDENLQPVNIGEKGELYIGGAQLARGYLNLPGQTKERFITHPFIPCERLYKTGDLAYWNPDGTIQFSGRADSQVKLRGYRVELEEIASAIEEHIWVKRAAAVVTDDPRTGFQNLVACVELNPKEAALMDQGNHGSHHQSKESKLQVKAQLSNPGLRDPEELRIRPVIELPGGKESSRQRREVFARKTYRFYEGGEVSYADLRELLQPREVTSYSRSVDQLRRAELGEILRWFGPFYSEERLLPKYAYASPGALYATQMYLETGGVAGLDAGVYYFHPMDHTLVRVSDAQCPAPEGVEVHFLGKKQAIEPVYRNNIQEVLEFETGHMLGVFEEVLPEYGLTIRPAGYRQSVKDVLDVAGEDYYLGTFEIGSNDGQPGFDAVEIFLQAHPGRVEGLRSGMYRYADGDFDRISDEMVLKKHVIAINQGAYESASFGITAVSRADQGWLEYVSLGKKLHHLQRNGLQLGFMSSGYSSKTGYPLPAAQRIDDILDDAGVASGASYFFLGGKVSEEQIRSTGMREDSVHMKGPTEMIRDDLARFLPDYMIPNRVLMLDELPLTANGKIDCKALAASEEVNDAANTAATYVAPETPVERWLVDAWGKALKYSDVSMEDTFFASGGNSLIAVMLTHKINREFGTSLPLQILFEYSKLGDLAARIEDDSPEPSSRLLLLHDGGEGTPVFAWPGLGGYPMNLRLLAQEAGTGGPFYGIQAAGINTGEVPYPTIRDMAAADVEEIRRAQSEGPYTLWGYSFGARVAFETAWQLEQAGEKVENLLLICPGNPKVRQVDRRQHGREASYRNPAYVTILFSVFAGSITGPELYACLRATRDEDSFVACIAAAFPALDKELVRRITRIVGETYEFDYSFDELSERRLDAPVTIFKASGDDYSFIEGRSGYSAAPPTVLDLEGDHYQVLKSHGVAELVGAIRTRLALS